MRTLFLLLPFLTFAQDWDTRYFVQYSQDMKMAISGPYEGDKDIGATYNAEYSVGYEQVNGNNGYRLTGRVEIHPAIDYTKATWLEIAYLRKIWVFNCYAGVEFQTIYRKNPNYDVTNPHQYTKYLNTPIQGGLNAELQYMITDYFGVATNINLFQPEDADGVTERWDVMCSVLIKI